MTSPFPRTTVLFPPPVTPYPIAIWFAPSAALASAPLPIITFCWPDVFASPAEFPTKTFSPPARVCFPAPAPMAVLPIAVVNAFKAS